ncbi:hypothetical protein EFU70_02670 [Vibrio cholerae]|nr:hypothetical protein [Vibrio cholerae]EGR1088378.1 hypothetical protein [Vibrio cholerae]
MLATFVHPNHIVCLCSLSMLMGTHSLAAYLQLLVVWVYQVVWVYIEILPRAFLSFLTCTYATLSS